MNKIKSSRVVSSISLVLLASVTLTGCISPASRRTADAIVATVNRANEKASAQLSGRAAEPMDDLPGRYGWAKLHDAIYGGDAAKTASTAKFKAQLDLGRPRFLSYLDDEQLRRFDYDDGPNVIPSRLKNKWAFKNLVKAGMSTNKVAHVNPFEIYGLASQIFEEVHSNIVSGKPIAISNAPLNFGTLLEAYFIAYDQGQFTMRDGTVLGKPTYSQTNTSGTLAVTIPDSTVTGVGTVFTEALNDFGFGTPLFYSLSNGVSYTAKYVSAEEFFKSETNKSAAPNSNFLVQVYYSSTNISTNYFASGKVPTCARFLPCIPVVANYDEKKSKHGGLTSDEAQFIRAMANLSETESKALAGLLVRSFGSVGAGGGKFAIGDVHVALGDNQVLAQLVEDLLSSFSSHVAEHELTEVFWKYQGGDKDVDNILKNYKTLLSILGGN